jgi:hypothetical protein
MITIKLFKLTGSFAENKDVARKIRLEKIMPSLEKNQQITLDFSGIEATTQSFIHALISDAIRKFGPEVLERINFKSCNDKLKKIILIVTEYMQI